MVCHIVHDTWYIVVVYTHAEQSILVLQNVNYVLDTDFKQHPLLCSYITPETTYLFKSQNET